MENSIFKKYKEIQKRFQLPRLDELQNTFRFEIHEEGRSDLILDQIRNEISEMVFSVSEKILEHILSGSDNICCMFEQGMITKKEYNEMFSLYKKIQALKWENNLLAIKYDEKRTIEWIKKIWKLWNSELEEKLMNICKKLAIGWEELKLKKEEMQYFC